MTCYEFFVALDRALDTMSWGRESIREDVSKETIEQVRAQLMQVCDEAYARVLDEEEE